MALTYIFRICNARLLKPFFDNILIKHGELPHVLPLAFHLIFLCAELVQQDKVQSQKHPKRILYIGLLVCTCTNTS